MPVACPIPPALSTRIVIVICSLAEDIFWEPPFLKGFQTPSPRPLSNPAQPFSGLWIISGRCSQGVALGWLDSPLWGWRMSNPCRAPRCTSQRQRRGLITAQGNALGNRKHHSTKPCKGDPTDMAYDERYVWV